MEIRDIRIPDYLNFVNSLLVIDPPIPAVASLRIDWSASHNKHHFRNEENTFDSHMVINSAQVWWKGETATSRYVTDPASTSTSIFSRSATNATVFSFRSHSFFFCIGRCLSCSSESL